MTRVRVQMIGNCRKLTATLHKASWPEALIAKVMGQICLRLLADVRGE